MRAVADFMRGLFDARIAEEREILLKRAPYRQKFFTPDCLWDSRKFTLEMIESETVTSIEGSGLEATVITEYRVSVSSTSAQINRRRYHLKIHDESFLIFNVERQCQYCHGGGNVECIGCHGKHWL
jgi:hypothetical protein